jgi:predicted PurR-regulated permease PerM
MKIGTRIGIYTGVLLSGYIFTIRYFDLTQNKFAFFGIFFIIILGIISSCLLFDKQTNFTNRFNKIFNNGIATTVTATFITVAIILISYIIVPSLKQNELLELKNKLDQDAGISANQKTEYYQSQADHFYSLKSSQYLFPFLICGALFSTIASIAIAAKNKK